MRQDVEEFWCIALNACNHPLATECLFKGTVDSCLFHPRDLFRLACLNNAVALIVAHNHPSGNHEPSASDNKVTRQMLRAAQIMQIPILDHLILTESSYFSYAEAGLIKARAYSEP